jgi:hypothetical protein
MVDLETLNQEHPDSFKDDDWMQLLQSIKFKNCTPIVGAGACAGVLPTGRELATSMAGKCGYPFNDVENLSRVAQYCGRQDNNQPKFAIIDEFRGKSPPIDDPYEPHRVMAELALPLYVTTNYDNFMATALGRVLATDTVREEACPWYLLRTNKWKPRGVKAFKPSEKSPLVFHLHGNLTNFESMVLTENDYLEFLLCWTKEPEIIPGAVADAFSSSTLLFMGYSLEDINFRLIFRRLVTYMQLNQGRRHISVQLEPKPAESNEKFIARAKAQREYLEEQLGNLKVKIYWGTCHQFARNLKQRWAARNASG